jgi:predicted acyl esterase
MSKPATTHPSSAAVRRVAGRLNREHPRSVPVVEDEGEPERDADQPFEEGSHDAIDPDLRHRLISEAAFEMYKRRDFADGYDLDDWLEAEEQIDHLLLHPATEAVPGAKG